MHRSFWTFVLIFVLTAGPFLNPYVKVAHAAVGTPKIISYQGRLANAAGTLQGGSGTTFHFKFSIWDDPTSDPLTGSKLWPTAAPGIATTTVKDGVFNVNIGDTVNGFPDALTYNFYDNRDVYLQVEVSSDGVSFETLSPRQRIAASGFALNAETVSGKLRVSTSSDYTFDVVNDGSGRANLSAEGQIRVGGFGAAPTSIGGGALYYNTSTGNLFLWNDATTTPQWISLGGGGGGGSTDLQAAYNLGNTITTTDARNISFTLDDTATDSNFVLNIKGVTSTGVFQIQASSSPIFTFGISSSTLATTTISNFTVTGPSSLQGFSFTNASGTSLTLTSVADLQGIEFTNASGTSLTLTGVADFQTLEFTNGSFGNASGTSLTLTGAADLQGIEFTNASGTSITLTGTADLQGVEFTNASGTSLTLTGLADLQGLEFTNASGTALTLTGAASVGSTLSVQGAGTAFVVTNNALISGVSYTNVALTPAASFTIGTTTKDLTIQGVTTTITSLSGGNIVLTPAGEVSISAGNLDIGAGALQLNNVTRIDNIGQATLTTSTITNLTVSGTSSLQGFSFTNASGTALTLTGVADLQGIEFTNASGTSLSLTGTGDFQNIEFTNAAFTNASGTSLSLTGVADLQGVEFTNASGTSITLTGVADLQTVELTTLTGTTINTTNLNASTTVINGVGTGLTVTNNVNISVGDLQTAGTVRLSNAGALQNIAGITGVGALTVSSSASGVLTLLSASSTLILNATETGTASGTIKIANLDLLVLGSRGDDPTGTNGAVYYSTSTNKFRCFENGLWKDCVGGAAGGGAGSLQTAYETSTDPEITLQSTPGGLSILDNTTPIAGNLFEVQNNARTKNIFEVSTTTIAIRPINNASNTLQVRNTQATEILFRVDTASNTVKIGDDTGVAAASTTILVLDTRADASDPNGVSGALYYNSTNNKFRCFEAGAWTDCIGAAGPGNAGFTDDGEFVRLTASTDQVGIGATSSAAKLLVQSTSAGTSTLRLLGASVQTANLFEAATSSGANLVTISPLGVTTLSGAGTALVVQNTASFGTINTTNLNASTSVVNGTGAGAFTFTNASGTSLTLSSVADLQSVEFTNASGTALTLTSVADLQGVEFTNASGTAITLTGTGDFQAIEFTNASGTSLTLTGVADLQGVEIGGQLSFGNASGTSITLTSVADLQGVEFTSATGTATGQTSLSLTGTPALLATSSLVLLGPNTIVGGNASGTFIGANPVGFNGNFIDFQVNSSTVFKVASSGAVTTGALSFTNASGTSLTLTGVADLQGVEFTNASGTSLTLTSVADLQIVEFTNASGTSLTLTGVADLQGVEFTNASGTAITLTGTADLQGIEFTNASGTSLTLTGVADLQGLEFTNASGTALSLTSNLVVGGVLTANTITPNGAMTIGSFGQNLTLQGSQVTIGSTSTNSIIFNASSTEVMRISAATGQILFSTSTPTTTAKIVIWGGVASETSSISGIYQESRINTAQIGNFQFGNRHIIYVAPTASTSADGEFIRTIDNTTLSNVVRALEVQAWSGTNLQGVNTGVFAAGRTFGVQAVSNGSAGGVAAPAALFGEITSATQGQGLRLYSQNIASTTQDLAQFYQEISAFQGTGLKMEFAASGGGTFTGNFVDFRRAGLTKFSVNATGSVTIAGSSTLVRASSTLIVCGQDQCNLSGAASSSIAWFASVDGATTSYSIIAKGRIGASEADYAEYVPVLGDVNSYEEGDLLAIDATTSLFRKTDSAYAANLVGAVSERAAFVAGIEGGTENKVIMAVAGRIPVKVTGENGSISVGDLIAASSEEGVGMRASATGRVLGVALENFSTESATSTGKIMVFINPHWYYTTEVEMLQGGGSGDMEMNNFTFDESLTTVIQVGTLVANKVYTLSLTVGTEEKPGGITLYDVQTKKPYCVLIEYGDLIRYPGTCEENYLVNPAAAPFAETSAPTSPSTENAVSSPATSSPAINEATTEATSTTESTTTEPIVIESATTTEETATSSEPTLEPVPEPVSEPVQEPILEPEPEPTTEATSSEDSL